MDVWTTKKIYLDLMDSVDDDLFINWNKNDNNKEWVCVSELKKEIERLKLKEEELNKDCTCMDDINYMAHEVISDLEDLFSTEQKDDEMSLAQTESHSVSGESAREEVEQCGTNKLVTSSLAHNHCEVLNISLISEKNMINKEAKVLYYQCSCGETIRVSDLINHHCNQKKCTCNWEVQDFQKRYKHNKICSKCGGIL